jgi:hypothetical protein
LFSHAKCTRGCTRLVGQADRSVEASADARDKLLLQQLVERRAIAHLNTPVSDHFTRGGEYHFWQA